MVQGFPALLCVFAAGGAPIRVGLCIVADDQTFPNLGYHGHGAQYCEDQQSHRYLK